MSAVAYKEEPLFRYTRPQPASEVGKRVEKTLRNAAAQSRDYAADWRTRAKAIIEEVANECSQRGWDGYDAQPVSDAARACAHAVVDMLPLRLAPPEVVPDIDGELALVWDFGPGLMFSLSAGADGKINYAGLLGNGVKRHGVEPFSGEVPSAVVSAIEELCTRAGALR